MRNAVVGICVLVSVAAACSGGSADGFQQIRDESREFFFELPHDWAVMAESELALLGRTPFVAQTSTPIPVISRVVFYGPGFAVGDALLDTATYPGPLGSAVVRTIPEGSRDHINRYLLAELVVPYHSQPIATEYLKQDVEVADGYEGVQLLVTYAGSEDQVAAAVLLIAVTDPDDRLMYSIAIGCSTECFGAFNAEIAAIVDSWLVNTR